jgi:16S rRNA C967 or C1407 C5-methylase (RsmB/RsmF family)
MHVSSSKAVEYYRQFYQDQTSNLFQCLVNPPPKIALINPWIAKEHLKDVMCHAKPQIIAEHTFYHLPKDIKPIKIHGLLSHYFLDLSSTLPALLLPIKPGMKVLDMCSAPGGKLLVMLSRNIDNVTWIANDVSKARILRLKKVLQDFIPPENNINISLRDAHYFGLNDVLRNAGLNEPVKMPSKSLAYKQYSLLASAVLALKRGGFVMYVTCTINPKENDGVIEKLIKKKAAICSLVKVNSKFGDETTYGTRVLPHLHNAGPLFFSLIQRV